MVARIASLLLFAGCLFMAPLLLACAGDDYVPELSIVNTTPFDLNLLIQQGATSVEWPVPANGIAHADPGFAYTEAGIATVTWLATTDDANACDPPVMGCVVDSGESGWSDSDTGYIFIDRTPGN